MTFEGIPWEKDKGEGKGGYKEAEIKETKKMVQPYNKEP